MFDVSIVALPHRLASSVVARVVWFIDSEWNGGASRTANVVEERAVALAYHGLALRRIVLMWILSLSWLLLLRSASSPFPSST
jgi:hypothetical protein